MYFTQSKEIRMDEVNNYETAAYSNKGFKSEIELRKVVPLDDDKLEHIVIQNDKNDLK